MSPVEFGDSFPALILAGCEGIVKTVPAGPAPKLPAPALEAFFIHDGRLRAPPVVGLWTGGHNPADR
jgi:hypothetical protein